MTIPNIGSWSTWSAVQDRGSRKAMVTGGRVQGLQWVLKYQLPQNFPHLTSSNLCICRFVFVDICLIYIYISYIFFNPSECILCFKWRTLMTDPLCLPFIHLPHTDDVGSRPQGRDLHAPLEGNVGPLDTVTYVDRLRAHGFSYEVSWSFCTTCEKRNDTEA